MNQIEKKLKDKRQIEMEMRERKREGKDRKREGKDRKAERQKNRKTEMIGEKKRRSD